MPQYCLVKHRISTYVIDGADSDRNPDRVPVTGTVTFEALLGKGDSVVVTEDGVATTITLAPIEARITNGEIYHRGEEGVKLFAGGPDANPERIRYRAEFSNLIAGGKRIDLKDILFEAVPGGELTLSMVQPVPGAPYPGYSATIEAGIVEIGRVRDEALGQVEGAVATQIGEVYERIPKLSEGVSLSWAVTDGDRAALAVTESGDVVIPRLSPDSVAPISESISAHLGDRLPVVRDEPSLAWAVTDGDHAALAVTESGDVSFGRLAPQSLAYLSESLDIPTTETVPAHTLIPDTSSGNLIATDPNTGQRAILAESPQNVRMVGDAVAWESDGRSWWQDTLDEGPWRVGDTTRWAWWGSSTMRGLQSPLNAAMAGHGVTNVHDGGWGWDRTEHIYGRMGLAPFELASSVSVSAGQTATISLQGVSAHGGAWTVPGELGGVRGEIGIAMNAFFFHAESTATIPAGAEFAPDAAVWRDATTLLNVGKNDISVDRSAEMIMARTIEGTDYLRSLSRHYMILGHFANRGQPADAPRKVETHRLNHMLKEHYGPRFIDLEGYLASPALWDHTGITPTVDDLQAQTDRMLPPSVSADAGHLSGTGYAAVVTNLLIPAFTSKGWL